MMRDLENKQENWVKVLIKPQELNQARLYAIEQRIKENETTRVDDMNFTKEVIKKFIFTIE